MKTSVGVDFVLSLGTGTSFLGEFVAAPARAAILSGESGEATLQETARRVAAAKGIDLALADVFWGFRLPQLANAEHLAALQDAVRGHGIQVLVLDPLYLSLLAGGGGLQASNLYDTGPLLMAVGQACLAAGCTPVLVHHFRQTRPDPYGEPQLDDLAFSGIQEYARQWVLLGRREKYQPGSGEHRLWLSVGGSAGHSGLWAVDIGEGVIDEEFASRTWNVAVTPAAEARKGERDKADNAKRRKQDEQDRTDDALVMAKMDHLDPYRRGYGTEQLRVHAALSDARMTRAVARLKDAGVVVELKVDVEVGNGAMRPAKGIRRAGG